MDSIKSTPTAAPAAPAAAQAPARAVNKAAVTYESESIREVQARAHHVRQGETATERRGVRRLDEAMQSGQDLRRDVPRGFYLNISV